MIKNFCVSCEENPACIKWNLDIFDCTRSNPHCTNINEYSEPLALYSHWPKNYENLYMRYRAINIGRKNLYPNKQSHKDQYIIFFNIRPRFFTKSKNLDKILSDIPTNEFLPLPSFERK